MSQSSPGTQQFVVSRFHYTAHSFEVPRHHGVMGKHSNLRELQEKENGSYQEAVFGTIN